MSSKRTRPRLFTRIHIRLATLFVVIFGSMLILFSLLLYDNFVEDHEKNFDLTLFNYAIDVANSINVNLFGNIVLTPNLLADSEKVFPFALGDTFLQVRTIEGRILARSRSLGRFSLPLTQEEREELISRRTLFKTLDTENMEMSGPKTWKYRMVGVLIEKSGGFDFVLQVAVPMRLLERQRKSLVTFFFFSIPIVLFIAALGGLYFSRRALAPVNVIISKTREITARSLSERVPVPNSDRDEMAELATTLNGLLDRLERAFKAQDAFIADASHQLKTPLAILRGEIDLIRSRPRSAEEIEEFMESASQEVDYLSRIIQNLLLLAKTEAGAASLSIQDVRMDEVALDVVAKLERIANAKGVRVVLNLHGDAYDVSGDAGLLRSMLENVVENAIKYSPEKGIVTLDVRDEGESVRVLVQDQGPGIDVSAMSRLFDRFYRVEERVGGLHAAEGTAPSQPASEKQQSGWGLGLAIAKRIAEIHEGTIFAEGTSETGGARFVISLRKEKANATRVKSKKNPGNRV